MYGSMGEMLEGATHLYRQDLWRRQPVHVEVWLEKLALSGVVSPVTREWGVPLFVTRGYASISCLEHAAREFEDRGKPNVILYFGDYDPSGVGIPRKAEEDLREFAPSIELDFRRVAVRRAQVITMRLPTRPTKPSDSRSAGFGDDQSVELDAISANQLRAMVSDAIEEFVDRQQLEQARIEEQAQKEQLRQFYEAFSAV